MEIERKVEGYISKIESIKSEISKVIVGQNQPIELMLLSILSKGHSIFVGVPGLAKTLLVNTLAQVLSLKFSRIQFTPDLMPSDITGSDVIEEEGGKKAFRFVPGPVFTNLLLADEINRTPPKTQSALLQAMQEYKVTCGGKTYLLEEPFIVFATQNPIELEGTYPLPEAQLDRFMFMIDMDYPSKSEEIEIVEKTTGLMDVEVKSVLNKEEVIELQKVVRSVPVAKSVVEFAVEIVRKTRPHNSDSPDLIKENVEWGAGPRGSQFLILGAKAKSLLDGRFSPTTEDVKKIAVPALKHRIVLKFKAKAKGIKSDELIRALIEK